MYVKSDATAETQAESLRLAVQCMTEYMYVNMYVNMCKRALYLPKRDLRLRKRDRHCTVYDNYMYVNMYANSGEIADTSAEFLCLAEQYTTEYMYVNMYVNSCVVAETRA